MFDGKSVLITGGTGSFGKKFVETLLERHKPRRVIVYSRDELKQYEMAQVFNDRLHALFHRRRARRAAPAPGVRRRRLRRPRRRAEAGAGGRIQPDGVHQDQHRRRGERDQGRASTTRSRRSSRCRPTRPRNPINLYGATKLASDKLFVAANNIAGGHRTRFSVVRYGNVVGSRGSVVPFFRKLLAQDAKELPITDARMTRFWITLQQGVDFVLESFERMHGGEIFVPKIPSIRITDLAEAIAPEPAAQGHRHPAGREAARGHVPARRRAPDAGVRRPLRDPAVDQHRLQRRRLCDQRDRRDRRSRWSRISNTAPAPIRTSWRSPRSADCIEVRRA